MSKTYRSIMFFSDEIAIKPHTATEAQHLNKKLSVRTFSAGKPMRLMEELETGDLVFEQQIPGGGMRFAVGPEVV